MSRTVDQKVVEMQFDNAKFERNIQTSISSLDRLKQSLNLDGAARGLDEIDASSKNCSSGMSGLSSGIETVGNKFSAMEIIAITALVNITNSAIEAGKRLVASLSIDQVTSGFAKYEEKTTAVQTIINATGKSIDEVNEQLEKLNWFTDETSYNFTDMVSNIGKFTSNGVELETSVTAMMGIANWAALSGQNAEAASRAMYNLSQSIGMGAVKLQDWKSIENANMATKEFKEIAIETAKALGVLTEEGETANGTLVTAQNFSSTLSDGWFTSDVLLAALDKYGNYSEEVYKVASEEGITAADAMKKVSSETMELGAKAFKAAQEAKTFTDAINATKDAVSSGWSTTFETIFGNYEEAKTLWTDVANELYDIFAASAEGRNELLAQWKELGGRDLMIESLMNTLQILKNVISAVSEAFHDIFPPMTAERLVNITQSIRDFTERLKNNEGIFNNITRIFRGFFAILGIGKTIITSLFRALDPLLSLLPGLGGGIANVAGGLGDFIYKLNNAIKETDFFYKVFSAVVGVIVKVVSVLASLIRKVKESEVFQKVSVLILKAFDSVKKFIGAVKERFTTPGFNLFHVILEKIYWILSKIGSVILKVASFFINAFKSMFQALSGSGFLEVMSKIWSIIVALGKCIFGLLGQAFSYLAEKLREADFKGLMEILSTISVGGIAYGITKFVTSLAEPFKGVKDILKGISGILDGVRGCFEAYQNKLKADTLFRIASAIAILVASLVVLSFIDEGKLMSGVAAIAMLFIELMTAMKVLMGFGKSKTQMVKATALMFGMSLAVLILASAVKKLSSLEPDALMKGLLGVAALVAIVVAATKALGTGTKTVMKGAAQLILFGFAIKILASACVTLSKLSWGDMMKGLIGVGILMAEVVGFLKFAKFDKKAFSTSLGMILLASAIKILASACKSFGQMDWGMIGKGLTSVAVLLLELAAFTRIVKPSKMVSTGLGLIGIATAMKIFASAMRSMASLSWEEIAKGLVSMAGCLAAVTVALNFLPKGMISKGLGLIAVATALLILSSAFRKMGNMSWSSVAKGLISLGGSLAILAVGLKLMKKTLSGAAALMVAAIALNMLAPALRKLGSMSWAEIGKSLLMLAGAFVILGVAGLVLGPLTPAILALSGALALIGVAVLAAGIGLVAAGAGLASLSAAFAAFCAAISGGASMIVTAFIVIVEGVASMIGTIAKMLATGIIEFIKVIGMGAPTIFEAVTQVVLGLIETLIACIPKLVECIFTLLQCVLATLVENTPSIVQAVFNILLACLQGIADNIGLVVQTAIDIVVNFIEGIAQKIPDVIQAGFDLVISFINGVADALDNNTGTVVEAMKRLIKSVLNAIVTVFSGGWDLLCDIGKNLMDGLVNGIKSAVNKVKDAVCSVGKKIKNWFCDLFGIHSPSRVFAEYGMYLDEGLADGLHAYSNRVEAATDDIGDIAIDSMTKAIADICDVVDKGDFAEPTIRPVMDLSEIQNGANTLSRMMDDANGYNMSASVDLAGRTAKSMNSSYDSDDSTAMDGIAQSIKKMAENPSQTFTNTFNITGNNPEEIAEEVSEILQKQVVRKGAVWE